MLVSASMLGRVMSCPASASGRQIGSTSEAAALGTAVHKFMEDVHHLGYDGAVDRAAPEALDFLRNADLSLLPFDISKVNVEQRVAYDVDSGRVFFTEDRQELPIVTGQADVWWHDDTTVYVADYKTGMPASEAKDSAQLKFICLALARMLGLSRAQGILIYLPGVHLDKVDLGMEDLTSFQQDLERTVASLRTGSKSLATGNHCKYCPMITSCPAMLEAFRAVSSDTPVTPRQAQDAINYMRTVSSRLSKYVWASALSGQDFAIKETVGPRQVVAEVAGRVILDFLPGAALSEFGTVGYSLTSLERGFKKVGMSKVWPSFLARLEAEGGLKRSVNKVVV